MASCVYLIVCWYYLQWLTGHQPKSKSGNMDVFKMNENWKLQIESIKMDKMTLNWKWCGVTTVYTEQLDDNTAALYLPRCFICSETCWYLFCLKVKRCVSAEMRWREVHFIWVLVLVWFSATSFRASFASSPQRVFALSWLVKTSYECGLTCQYCCVLSACVTTINTIRPGCKLKGKSLIKTGTPNQHNVTSSQNRL